MPIDPKNVEWSKSPTEANIQWDDTEIAPELNVGERLARTAGLAGRAAVRGVSAFPSLMAEALAYPLRQATGGKYFPSPTATLESYMTKAGLPEPQNATERIAVDIGTGISGAGAFAGAARALASSSGVVGGIASQIARQPLAQSVAAGTGAGAAGLAREAGAGPFGQLAAGLAGAAAPSVISGAVSGAGRVGRALTDPMHEQGQRRIIGNVLRASSGKSADRELHALRNAKELVPGSEPTAAQVAESGGMSALERSVSQSAPERFSERMMEQNAARLHVLRTIAKSNMDVSQAQSARDAAVKPFYEIAKKATVESDDTLRTLLSRPSVSQAWERARRIAQEEGQAISREGRYTGRGLHYLKMALDDMLDDPTTSIGRTEKAAITQTRKELLDWISDKIPEYNVARQLYAEMSQPIDQMRIGQALLDKLEPALNQGGLPIRVRASSFAEALRKGDDLAKQITGFEGARLSSVLSKEQLEALNSVRLDLARSAVAADLGRGVGSNTFQNIAQENIFQAAGLQGLPQLLSRPVQLTNYLLRGIYSSANREMRDRLADILLDPKQTAELMALPPERWTEYVSRTLSTGRQQAQVLMPAIVNQNQGK